MRIFPALVLFLVVPVAIANAAEKGAAGPKSTLTGHNRSIYNGVKQIVLRSANKMPEASYSFKPAETVRTFGQIVGHAADAQYTFCSAVLGEKNPALNIEKSLTSKGELIEALEQAFAYCDKAYESLDDKNAADPVRFMGGDRPKLGVLHINNVHTTEHYGNLVTYLRMNGIVPPTSEPEFMKQLGK